MIIRREKIHDFEDIDNLMLQAFEGEFEKDLVRDLRSGESYINELALVSENEDEITGYLMFSKLIVKGIEENNEGLALAPLAVKEGFRNIGVGKALVRQGIALARALGYKYIIVLGHSAYYKSFGFENASKYGIKAPFPVEDDNFMALELRDEALKNVEGTVVYSKEFGI